MQKILCPVCGKPLNLNVGDGFTVDFDMRTANQVTFCNTCKRRIKYKVVEKQIKATDK